MILLRTWGGAAGRLATLFALAAAGSAQTTLVFDDFDDGVLGPAWNEVFFNATGWSFSESADARQTLLQAQSFQGVPTGTSGGVYLDWSIPPAGEIDLTYVVSWNGDDSMYITRVRLLDAAGETVAYAGPVDVWIQDQTKSIWQAGVGSTTAQGASGSLPLSGTNSFHITRDSANLMTVSVGGSVKVTETDARAVHTVRIQLFRHGSWPYGAISVDLIDVSGTVCAGGASLLGGPDSISVAAGGTQEFFLETCPPAIGDPYLLLGTVSGTTPGIPVDSVVLPLTSDPYFLFTVSNANTPPLTDSFGLLDGSGAATASLTVPAGLPASFVGLTLHHAFLVFDALSLTAELASNALALQLDA